MAFSLYQAGEPGRRARHIHQVIHPGMSVGEVEGLLAGRVIRSYRLRRDADWEEVSRDAFLAGSGTPAGVPRVARQIDLHFMGAAPLRVSFSVEFDEHGLVSGTTVPKGWE
jgi:hypothetical protein